MAAKRIPIKKRLLNLIDKTADCWEWKSSKTPLGYGQIITGYMKDGTRKNQMAHRVVYETFVGKIPEGLTIDHLCRNKSCVNPEHLEVVTYSENQRRAMAFNRKTHCKHGHKYVDGSYYIYGNYRKCKTCNNESNRRNWRKYYYGKGLV